MTDGASAFLLASDARRSEEQISIASSVRAHPTHLLRPRPHPRRLRCQVRAPPPLVLPTHVGCRWLLSTRHGNQQHSCPGRRFAAAVPYANTPGSSCHARVRSLSSFSQYHPRVLTALQPPRTPTRVERRVLYAYGGLVSAPAFTVLSSSRARQPPPLQRTPRGWPRTLVLTCLDDPPAVSPAAELTRKQRT